MGGFFQGAPSVREDDPKRALLLRVKAAQRQKMLGGDVATPDDPHGAAAMSPRQPSYEPAPRPVGDVLDEIVAQKLGPKAPPPEQGPPAPEWAGQRKEALAEPSEEEMAASAESQRQQSGDEAATEKGQIQASGDAADAESAFRSKQRSASGWNNAKRELASLGNIRAAAGMGASGKVWLSNPNTQDMGEFDRADKENKDMMSPGERAMISKKFGFNVPEGSSWSNISKTLPAVAQVMRAQGTPMQQQAQDLRKRGLDQQDKRIGQAEIGLGLRKDTVEQGDTRLGRPPAKQQEEALALNRAGKYLDLVDKDYQGVKDKIGPIYGRLQNVIRSAGYGDPQVAQLMANLRDAAGDYLTLKTGAQRGMPEIQFLMKAIPDVTDANEPFEALLKSWRDRIQIEKTGRQAQAKRYGYKDPFTDDPTQAVDTTTTRDDKATAPAPAAPAAPAKLNDTRMRPGTKVRVISPDGKPGQIPAEDWPAAQKEGYKRS